MSRQRRVGAGCAIALDPYGPLPGPSEIVERVRKICSAGRQVYWVCPLIEESEKVGMWTLQASIFPENAASVSLHRGCGFREVGTRERIAKMNGVWRDTLLLERRSKAVADDQALNAKTG